MNASNQITRILTIDDNPAIHEDFRKILVDEKNQHELNDAAASFFGVEAPTTSGKIDADLDSALQGKDGYAMVQKAVLAGRPYTLAFCDMRMPPGWDGLTTIEHLWKADPNLQVVICSAYSDKTWADITDRLGHSDQLLILKKPFDNAEVLQIAVALIEKRRLMDAANLKREELELAVEDRTQKLAAAREDSERLIDAIDSVLIQVDSSHVVRRWNHQAMQLFRVSAGEAIGTKFSDLPVEWEHDGDLKSLVMDPSLETSKRVVATLQQPFNGSRVVNAVIYPVCVDNKYEGKLVLASDQTEQRLLEQQLNQASKLESVGQLAAGVAHEINTPMQYISDNLNFVQAKFERLIQYVDKAKEFVAAAESSPIGPSAIGPMKRLAVDLKLDKISTQIPEALSDSVDGVGHVAKIVKAMKELSHPGGDEMINVDINRVIQSTVTVSTNEWKYVARTELDLASDLPLVMGFPGELNQVFLNLIVNAAQAIRENAESPDQTGKIAIRTYADKESVFVEIEDTGGGIPQSIRGRVFDPFFTTKEVGVGTGQGLSISHNVIVHKHNGQLAFDVNEGVGTTFNIRLPLNPEQTKLQSQSEHLVTS